MTTPTGHVFLVKRRRGPQFYAKWREPSGRQVQQRLGPAWTEKGRPPAGYLTKRTANAWLDAKLVDLRRGIGERVEIGAAFGDAVAEWLRYVEHDRGRRPSTMRDYRNCARQLEAHFGKETPLGSITTSTIERWQASLEVSARTKQKLLVITHGVFRRAAKVYGLRDNPVADVEKPTVRRSNGLDVLSPAVVEALARAADTDQDAALFRVAAYTGLRLGEARGLRWSDIDFSDRLVHVRRNLPCGGDDEPDTPKSGLVRSVPLADVAMVALDSLSRRERFTDAGDYVFPADDGSPFDDSAMRKRFHAALDRAELRRIRFHDLRHVFGSLAVRTSPLTDVKAWMGHADIQTTMRYVHYTPQHDAAERLSKVFATDAVEVAESAQEGWRDIGEGSARPEEISTS